jgi:hypothetical protein
LANPTSSHLVAKQEETAKEIMNLALGSIFVLTSKVSLTCHKILQHGANIFTSPSKEGVLWNFIALKISSPSTESELANLGSKGRPTNHYTTKDEREDIYQCSKQKVL